MRRCVRAWTTDLIGSHAPSPLPGPSYGTLLPGHVAHGSSQTCQRVLCATHFHEIFDFALLDAGPGSPFQHLSMSILESQQQQQQQQQGWVLAGGGGGTHLTFLYALVPGGRGRSWGFHCAKLSGIPADILRRGEGGMTRCASWNARCTHHHRTAHARAHARTHTPCTTGREVAECIQQHRLIPKHYTPAQEAKRRQDARLLRHFLTLDCGRGSLDGLWAMLRTPGQEADVEEEEEEEAALGH